MVKDDGFDRIEGEIDEDVLAAGVNALNQFDPMDWADCWVSSEEIVRSIYGAMLSPNQIVTQASTSRSRYRKLWPASVYLEMIRTR